ncbi:tyrosine-type recombinase/integrase [Jeotgalibacillus sp. ET6]|uniref:tyrosine-type recombinase/integrase n=1 Tax=Jeotgalibacillus sp. ET6 TaxID=3037260 RepID=UPI0024187774|nr:tyrosine-type recombinase/integrase [Jeotgalibacillus sp. ET6]MDG5473694.1 tyrosine-type recombinase/integrase [Jeotgalibacillus sp. ET6]
MAASNQYWISTHEKVSKESKQILNEYLLSLKVENKAAATITKYRRIMEQFLRECLIPIEDLTSEDVRGWLDIFSLDKKPRTIDLYISALSTFFSFCLDEEYMGKAVMKKRWRPKIPKALPKYLDEFEYARVKVTSEHLSVRNRALLLFLFSTGCRVSEVVNLRVQDIDFDRQYVDVTGKGQKIRRIYFSEECDLVLSNYLERRSAKPTDPLFMNRFGNGLQVSGIHLVLKKVGVQAELVQSFHPHMCRHTFATNMLARGADLQFIADVMGHADLNTTRIYAQIPTEVMKLTYQNIMG